MSKALRVEWDLPDDAFGEGFDEVTFTTQVKEVVVMRLLEEHRISQGKAAELLGLSRAECFDLMAKYEVPVSDLSADDLRREFEQADVRFRKR